MVSRSPRIAPSILSADFGRLGDEVRNVVAAGATVLHLDVMDGHFVPNITFGPPLVKSIRLATTVTLDCHLMITDPVKYVGAFCDAGADWVSIHAEAPDDLAKAIAIIRSKGKSPGIVINPDTPLEKARPYFATTDFILVMSVFPGFGGQSFIASVLDKVRALRAEGYTKTIEIDGGINVETAPLAVAAGVDVLVAGTAVFGQKDRGLAMRALLPA